MRADILTDTLELARRIELGDARGAEDSIRAQLALRPDCGAVATSLAGGVAVYGGVDSPLSRARALGMSGPVSEDELACVEAFYRWFQLPTRFELCPYADPTLVAAAARRGYRLTGFVNVFVRDLFEQDLFEPYPERAAAPLLRADARPGSVRVRRIDKREGASWSRLVGQGFGEDEPSATTLDIGLAQLDREHVACFQAEIDGLPVAGGVVGVDDGIAYLFAGSTLAALRGRGAQTALIAARVAYARDVGCRLASVASSAGSASQRNIERAGFRLIYTRASLELDS